MAEANRNIAVNTFNRGMNKDLANAFRSGDIYYDSQNMRLVPDDNSGGTKLKLVKGLTVQNTSIPAGQFIAGYCVIRDYLILFTTSNLTPTAGGTSQIWRASISDDGVLSSIVKLYDDSLNVDDSNLEFAAYNTIIAVGYYETSDIINVYWVDSYNNIRHANVADYLTENGGPYASGTNDYIAADNFDFTPNSSLTALEVSDVVGGSLKAGAVIYTYKLYNENGSESLLAPFTKSLYIADADYKDITNIDFRGSDVETETNIGFQLKADINDPDFDRIQLIAIHFENLDGVPSIRVAEDKEIAIQSDGYVYLTDSGKVISELILDELFMSPSLFVASDIEIKNNRLFAANIKEDDFDIDYDARAYRFRLSESLIYNEDGSYYTIATDGSTTYSGAGFTGSDWTDIPETADCINRYNDLDNTYTTSDRYIYNKDLTRIGGSGPNVEYVFTIHQIELDQAGDSRLLASGYDGSISYTDYTSPLQHTSYIGYNRDEVYRFGFIGIDSKGRSSYVKWIGDIRMPYNQMTEFGGTYTYNTESDYSITHFDSGSTYANVLGIEFTFSNLPSEIVAYRIVRVKRTANDRSVLANGFSLNSFDQGGDDYAPGRRNTADRSVLQPLDNHPFRFFSPEISFNRNLIHNSGDFLQVCERWTNYHAPAGPTEYANLTLVNPGSSVYKVYNTETYQPTYYVIEDQIQHVISEGKIVGPADPEYTMTSGYTYYPRMNDAEATLDLTSGTAFVYPGTNVNWDPQYDHGSSNEYMFLMNYRRNKFGSQYGGNSYTARELNEYIPCTDRIPVGTTTVEVYGGDTFISYYTVATLITDLTQDYDDSADTASEWIAVPVETSINLNYQMGEFPTNRTDLGLVEMAQETAGDWLESGGNTYHQEKDLYSYNSVYSQESTLEVFYPKPSVYTETKVYDTRIKASYAKVTGEISDSWLKFGVNDYLDLNSLYGPLNSLYVFKDKLLFWQTSGFGYVGVNERSLITDNNPGELVLGTGTVLNREYYISEDIGNTNRSGIINSPFGIYWLDNRRKIIYRFTDKISSLSIEKGMQTFLNKYHTIYDMQIGFDAEFNELLFTIEGIHKGSINSISGNDHTIYIGEPITVFRENTDISNIGLDEDGFNNLQNLSTGAILSSISGARIIVNTQGTYSLSQEVDVYHKQTLVFSERDDAFQGFYSIDPRLYINSHKRLLSVDKTARGIYSHNSGANRTFYSGNVYDASVSIKVTDNFMSNKVFDNLSWYAERVSLTNNVILFDDTFTKLRVRNSYQNTDWYDLVYKTAADNSEHPFERRERTFDTYIPRNAVNGAVTSELDTLTVSNLDKDRTFKERIRDHFIIVDFKLDGTSTNDLSISYLHTKYRINYR